MGRSNCPRFQIQEKALSTTEIVSWSGKLSSTRKRDQSLFSLLLEIESRLREEGRNDQIERRKRFQTKRSPAFESQQFLPSLWVVDTLFSFGASGRRPSSAPERAFALCTHATALSDESILKVRPLAE
jgi:hypothetical protein